MTIFSGIVVFILIWWMVFFCLLPLNIQNIQNPKDGTMPGAPVDPGLKRKALLATSITAVFWVIAYALITSKLISFSAMAQRMAM